MGMILFLILACGLPGLILLYLRQRIPDIAWAGLAVESPKHAAPFKPSERREGYLGGATAEGTTRQNSTESLSVHGADIEHGLTSNTLRTDAKEQGAAGTSHDGSASGREPDKSISLAEISCSAGFRPTS